MPPRKQSKALVIATAAAMDAVRHAVRFNDRADHRGAADDRPSAVIRLGGMATGASRKIDITALGPAAVDTVLWQMAGRLHVTIVAKASFSFEPDAAMARVEPEEILRAEIHHNKNPMRSVRSTGISRPSSRSATWCSPGTRARRRGRRWTRSRCASSSSARCR